MAMITVVVQITTQLQSPAVLVQAQQMVQVNLKWRPLAKVTMAANFGIEDYRLKQLLDLNLSCRATRIKV